MAVPEGVIFTDRITHEVHNSVAAAKADVFRKNGISVGKIYAKILKIFDNIGRVKNRGVI